MEEKCNSIIKTVSRQFLCCVPIQEIALKNVIDDLTTDYDLQQVLIKNTVDLQINLKYPTKINYQIAFLKEIISKLARQNAEIHDDVYSAYGRLVALPTQTEYFYKHYIFGDFENESIITLKESSSLISRGTTGLTTWQASLALNEWIFQNKTFFSQKTILELGSGIGLTGLVVAKICSPKCFFFTDCHASVMNLLCENVNFNIGKTSNDDLNPELENRCQYNNKGPPQVSVLNLSWEEIDETVCKSLGSIDTLIAADIVYDVDLFDHLITAVTNLYTFCNVESCIFSCTERNPQTLESFRKRIEESGFKIREATIPSQENFYWPTDTPIKILYFNK